MTTKIILKHGVAYIQYCHDGTVALFSTGIKSKNLIFNPQDSEIINRIHYNIINKAKSLKANGSNPTCKLVKYKSKGHHGTSSEIIELIKFHKSEIFKLKSSLQRARESESNGIILEYNTPCNLYIKKLLGIKRKQPNTQERELIKAKKAQILIKRHITQNN
jgi:hypothetical protein